MSVDCKSKARSALIYDYLLRHTAEDVPATRDFLCELFNCDRKTIQKEMSALEACDFGIYHKRVGHQFAYYYSRNNFLAAERLQIYVDELHSGNFLSGEAENELNEAVEAQLDPKSAGFLKKTTVTFNTHKHTDAPTVHTISVLQDAILKDRQVSFRYFDWNENHEHVYRNDGNRYQVHPIGMVIQDDNYYLQTYNTEAHDIRPFRIDRIDRAVRSLDPICEEAVLQREHVGDFTKQAFRMYAGPMEKVTLQFTNKVINYVFDKFGGDTQITRIDDNWCQASVKLQISPVFWGWMFQFAGDIRIVEPAKLKEEYAERLQKVLSGIG